MIEKLLVEFIAIIVFLCIAYSLLFVIALLPIYLRKLKRTLLNSKPARKFRVWRRMKRR